MRSTAEMRYERASASSATGAVSVCTKKAGGAGTGHVGRCPAAVKQRVGLHVVPLGHQGHEQGAVRNPKEHGQRAGQKRHDVELVEGEHVEEERHRHRGQQQCPTDVRDDHYSAPVRVPVDPGTGQHREEQVRDERGGDQVAHFGGAGMEAQHGK
jgi:hypothetical protein